MPYRSVRLWLLGLLVLGLSGISYSAVASAEEGKQQFGGIEAGKWVLGFRAGFAPLTQQLSDNTSTSIGPLVNFQGLYSVNTWFLAGLMVEWERHGVNRERPDVDLGHQDTVSVLPTIELRPVRLGQITPYVNMSFRKLASGKKWEITNSSDTAILTLTESTGALTNATIDGEGSGNTITLYQRVCGGDLAGINPTDSSALHVWNKDPLSTAPTLTARSGTNRGSDVLTFPDADNDYGVQITCEMPTTTGNVDVVIWWDTTGPGNARFQMASKFYASGDADDAAFNTASVVTAAAGTSGRPTRVVLSNLTVTGIGANKLGRFRFFRNRTEGSDTLNAALNVEKVEVWAGVQY